VRLLSFRPGFTPRPFDCLSLGLDVFVSEQQLREKTNFDWFDTFSLLIQLERSSETPLAFRSRLRPRPAGSRPPLFISILEFQFCSCGNRLAGEPAAISFRRLHRRGNTPRSCAPPPVRTRRALFVRTRAHQFEFGFLKKKTKTHPSVFEGGHCGSFRSLRCIHGRVRSLPYATTTRRPRLQVLI